MSIIHSLMKSESAAVRKSFLCKAHAAVLFKSFFPSDIFFFLQVLHSMLVPPGELIVRAEMILIHIAPEFLVPSS